ncbi:WXG100 family type VII secretion target [Arthrobacter sp. 35W]|uniref:WXG100 family type VII secretion target n=1 Tax=Arthrobacter sp. 35W TaxID=1132441 RepID=UPI00041EEC43|nr:hypothetical protein [Arthrobacter sp. 35W]
MANGIIGNDPADMADLMGKLDHAVNEIHNLTNTLDSKAQSVRWEGQDANNFKHSQWPDHKRGLKQIAAQLEEVKNTVKRQKEEQERTSSH